VNLPTRLGVLHIGDRVRLGGTVHTITALTGMSVRLVAQSGHSSVVLLTHLLSAADFEALDAPAGPGLPRPGLLDGLPAPVVARARAWERHLVEIDTGLPPDAPTGARPQPDYDPARRSLRQREAAKAAELTAAGEPTSPRTVQRLRLRYQSQGLLGLVDRRAMRPVRPLGNADPRLVAAIVAQLDGETTQSTGTRGRLRRRVEATLTAEHGQGMVALPSKATFNSTPARWMSRPSSRTASPAGWS
jgi:putative transposase